MTGNLLAVRMVGELRKKPNLSKRNQNKKNQNKIRRYSELIPDFSLILSAKYSLQAGCLISNPPVGINLMLALSITFKPEL